MPRIGSISHGTLKTEDLVAVFADTLKELAPETYEDMLQDWLEQLQESLEEQAPPYTYFGTHEGDGPDFGFWPDMEAINELPRLNSGPMSYYDQAIALGEDCAYVNDHGNVTVYSSTGEIILEIV